MLTMISSTFICQNLSFFFFGLTWHGVGEAEYLGRLPTSHPPRREEVSLLSSFFQSIKSAWNMRLWSNVRGFCATIWSSRMSSTAASNRRLEGKVAIVTASTDGWVTQYFFSSFQLQIELMKSRIESEAQKRCSHICKKRKLKSKEEFTD